MYAIQDGKHISVEQGESETTDFTERILLQSAKNAKQLFHIYDFLIPIFTWQKTSIQYVRRQYSTIPSS